mmetsp:Transcript_18914/g.35072  ORF Transcript_18914/g.35072 Transcript_18914/m.35072 type:complete len:217 (+) Transcript_18914:175-825(+)
MNDLEHDLPEVRGPEGLARHDGVPVVVLSVDGQGQVLQVAAPPYDAVVRNRVQPVVLVETQQVHSDRVDQHPEWLLVLHLEQRVDDRDGRVGLHPVLLQHAEKVGAGHRVRSHRVQHQVVQLDLANGSFLQHFPQRSQARLDLVLPPALLSEPDPVLVELLINHLNQSLVPPQLQFLPVPLHAGHRRRRNEPPQDYRYRNSHVDQAGPDVLLVRQR